MDKFFLVIHWASEPCFGEYVLGFEAESKQDVWLMLDERISKAIENKQRTVNFGPTVGEVPIEDLAQVVDGKMEMNYTMPHHIKTLDEYFATIAVD